MTVYDHKPSRFLVPLHPSSPAAIENHIFCAGFDRSLWRCDGLAFHLTEWILEYSFPSDVLRVMTFATARSHLKQAAYRIYKTENFANRGEVGEIAAHCICRDFFNTIPVAPRAFYKGAANDVVKGFDLVHVRFPAGGRMEIWLGEAKTYTNRRDAIEDAVASVRKHVEAGVLTEQKLLIAPTIDPSTPHRDLVVRLFDFNTRIDELVGSAVFPIVILAESDAIREVREHTDAYTKAVERELAELDKSVIKSGLRATLKIHIFYVPLLSKAQLLASFHKELSGLQ